MRETIQVHLLSEKKLLNISKTCTNKADHSGENMELINSNEETDPKNIKTKSRVCTAYNL